MIKTITFFIILFYSFESFSFKGDFSVVFQYKNKLNFSEKITLERSNKSIKLNGIILPSEKIIVHKSTISYLVLNKLKSTSRFGCAAGGYVYEIKKEGKNSKEEGCLESDRFKKLMRLFKSI